MKGRTPPTSLVNSSTRNRHPGEEVHASDLLGDGDSSVNASESALICSDICGVIRSLTFEMLEAPTEGQYKAVQPSHPNVVGRPPRLDPQTKAIIGRVRTFFEELKRQLGDEVRGTVFNAPMRLTALSCGVSRTTVKSISASSSVELMKNE